MAIDTPAYRPTATPVNTVGDAPRFQPGSAPSAAPMRSAPVQLQSSLPTPPLPTDADALMRALGGLGSTMSALGGVIEQEKQKEITEAKGEYYAQFMKGSPDEQDALYRNTRDHGSAIRRAAADEIYGNLIGARRVSQARQLVESGQMEPADALTWLHGQADQDLGNYDSRHFRVNYSQNVEKGSQLLTEASDKLTAERERGNLENAIFESGKTFFDQYAAAPGSVPDRLGPLFQKFEDDYGPKGSKGKLSYPELDKIILKLVDYNADKGRKDIVDYMVNRARGDNPALANTAAYGDIVAELQKKADTRFKELDTVNREKLQFNLAVAANEGNLPGALKKYGFKSIEDAISAEAISGEGAAALQKRQEAGATLAYQKSNAPQFAIMEGLKAQGLGSQGEPDSGVEPLSMASKQWQRMYGDKLVDALRDDHVNFLSHNSQRLAKLVEDDKQVQKATQIAQATGLLVQDPLNWHQLRDMDVPSVLDPTKTVHVTKEDLQDASSANRMNALFEQYKGQGPAAVLTAQASFLRAGNIKYKPWADDLANGMAIVGSDAQLDPGKIPQGTLTAYSKWQALKAVGGDATAAMLAGDEKVTGKWEAVDILTQQTGTDEAGVRNAIAMVASKAGREKEMEAERARIMRFDARTHPDVDAVSSAARLLRKQWGQEVTNPGMLPSAIKNAAMDLQIYAGLHPTAAYTKAAEVVARSWGVVDGVAVPLTSVGSVPDLTNVSRFVAQEYAKEHPDVDAKDLVLRPFNLQAGIWGLADRSSATFVLDAGKAKTWNTGPSTAFNGMTGRFSTDQLLNLKKAHDFALQQGNSAGTHAAAKGFLFTEPSLTP